MNSLHFITYGDKNFSIQRKRIGFQAKKFKLFKQVSIYNEKSLEKKFKKEFSILFQNQIGGGFWIWKPKIILEKLKTMEEKELLIYCDSGSTLNYYAKSKFLEYIKIFKESTKELFLFELSDQIENQWTTREVFHALNVTKRKDITDSKQLQGSFIMIKNSKFTQNFFSEVIEIVAKDNNLITDYYDNLQSNNFIGSRNDQSIISVLAKLKGCYIHKDECHFHNNSEIQLNYPILHVRDKHYNLWQKCKFYFLYPVNINRLILFNQGRFYFKKTFFLVKTIRRIKNYFKKINFR